MEALRNILVAAALSSGCVFVEKDCPHCDDDLDCTSVAIRDAEGNPDLCDVAACTACADTCDTSCAVLESYPPRYSCPEGSSFSVYDVCPDWTPPAAPPRAEDVVDLGCGAAATESLTAVPTGPGQVAVVHVDYGIGCCPMEVQVGVEATDATLTVAYTLVDDLCDCACSLDVSYDLVDVPAGEWTIVAGLSPATTTVTVP